MLVCGCVSPPPQTDPNYKGIYFHVCDDMPAKAKGMCGTPLRMEHVPDSNVGRVKHAWLAPDGSLYALAEIDTTCAVGALAASYIKTGIYKGFSLGYRVGMSNRNQAVVKTIHELSLCREGAHEGCIILKIE